MASFIPLHLPPGFRPERPLVPPRPRGTFFAGFTPPGQGARNAETSEDPVQAPPTVSPEVETTFAPTLTPTVDVDAEKTRAYEKGRAQGLAEMRGEMERLQQDIQVLNPILTELATAKKRAVTSANETIASLVLALAHRIAGDSLALHPDALPQLVKRTLERLPEEDEIWVRVPPDDVKRVADSLGPRHRVKVLGDEHITAGCVIETRQAQVDCTLDAAMQGLEGAVRTWLESMA